MRSFTKSVLVLGLAVVGATANIRAGSLVTYEYDAYGNCTSITTKTAGAPDSQALERTIYSYDDYRRPTSMTESAQNCGNQSCDSPRTWTWIYDRYVGTQGYDPYAHTSKQWRVQIEPAFDATGKRSLSARWFDANDRIVDEYAGMIQNPSGGYEVTSDTEVHHFAYDENGQKKQYTDPLGRVTDYTYDLRNRLQDTIEPKRADQAARPTTTTEYDFAGNKTKVTFPDQQTQRWETYDAFGQPAVFYDERNNKTDLAYKVFGPMKKLGSVKTYRAKDGGGMEEQLTAFTYDGLGRTRDVAFPDGSHELTTYAYGQPSSFTTRKGQVKTIEYDGRGREIRQTFTGDAAAPEIKRAWDDANRVLRLCNIYSTIGYDYDKAGLVKTESNSISGSGALAAVISYTRYPNGSVSDVQYPDAISIHREYNARGQLKTVSDGRTAAPAAAYTYRPDGKVDNSASADGTTTTYGYDNRGLISSILTSRGGQEIWKRDYYRDNRDRIVALRRGTSGNMENGRGDHFWYDAEGQLTDAYYGALDPVNSPNSQVRQDHFVYDEMGNRRDSNLLASRGWMAFARDNNGLNQYGAWGSSAVQHDDDIGPPWGTQAHANGVMMFDGTMLAGYNSLNQPMYINSPSAGWVSFGYDPLGRCVKRWAGLSADPGTNPATYFYYDGWNLVQEGPSAATATRNYIHGARVDEIIKQIRVTDQWERYFHYDARSHCAFQTDAGGNIVEQYDYDAFGQPYFYNGQGASVASSEFGNRFLFTGREYLSDLKLYDYRNRMYQPELGRFMQPDPKQFAAGDYNLYRYCHNDPVNKSDPLGLYWEVQEFNHDDNWKIWQMILTSEKIPGPVGDRFRYIANSPYRMVIIPIQTDRAGQEKWQVGAREKAGDRTNQTTANDPVNNSNGRGVGSRVEFDPNNAKDPAGNPRAPIDAFGHEAGGHGYRNITGTNSGDKAKEEQEARKFQIEFHKDLEKLKK